MLSSLKVYSYHKHQIDFPFVLNKSEINMNKATVCTKASLQLQEELDLTTNSFRIFNTDKFISEKNRRVFEGKL